MTTTNKRLEPELTDESKNGWCFDMDDEEEDPDRELRERQEREHATVFIGYGKVGFYSPYAYLSLPFRLEGSVLPNIVHIMSASALVGFFVDRMEWRLSFELHSLMGFVLGFLLVILGNFSHNRYNSAIATINMMVQDGQALTIEIFAHLRLAEINGKIALADGVNAADVFANERAEFRRLVLLYFRLAAYEVRADIQARKNRYTWLDPDGGVCTDEARMTSSRLNPIILNLQLCNY